MLKAPLPLLFATILRLVLTIISLRSSLVTCGLLFALTTFNNNNNNNNNDNNNNNNNNNDGDNNNNNNNNNDNNNNNSFIYSW